MISTSATGIGIFHETQRRIQNNARQPAQRLRWPATLWVGIVAWLVPFSAFAAPPRVEVQTIRVGFDASGSSMKASNTFKIGTWTPVWVQLRGGAERFSGLMEVAGRGRRWNAVGFSNAGRGGCQQD